MTSSGIPSFPAIPPLPGQVPPQPHDETPADPPADIIAAPPDLQNVQQAVQLLGKVVESNQSDGRVTVQTDRGLIDLAIPKPQTVPAEGQSVELQIPPGRPPQNAVVTPVADNDPSDSAPPRSVETPVIVDVKDARPPEEEPPGELPPRYAEPVKTLPVDQVLYLRPVATTENILAASDALQPVTATLPDLALFGTQIAQGVSIDGAGQSITTAPPLVPLKILPVALYQPLGGGAPLTQVLTPVIKTPPALIGQIAFPALNTAAGAAILPITLTTPAAGSATALPVTGNNPLSPLSLTATPSETLQIPAGPLGEIIKGKVTITQDASPQITVPGQSINGLPVLSPLKGGQANAPNALPLILHNTPAHALSATILGQTADKLPLLQLNAAQPEGTRFFALQIPVENIPAGTQLSIIPQISPGNSQALLASLQSAQSAPVSFLSPDAWPLLTEINQVMAQIAPQAAQSITNIMPSPTANASMFGPAALLFIAAVQGGDLTQWLGERGIETIRRAGRTDLLSRLSQDGLSIGRLIAEPVTPDWRGMSLPLMWQNEVYRMALFYKDDQSGSNDGGKKDKQTRFIFDLKLDHMGKVQLDGLCRLPRLDLIVRTETPFSQTMQMTMRRAYTDALETAGVNGELAFQNRPDQWVTIAVNNKNMFSPA